jgi:hypothetical protein
MTIIYNFLLWNTFNSCYIWLIWEKEIDSKPNRGKAKEEGVQKLEQMVEVNIELAVKRKNQ